MRATRAVQGKPQLQPVDLNGFDGAAATITTVDYRDSKVSDTKGEKKFVLTFAEFEGRELWVNKTGQNALIDHYGEETNGWVGHKVPLTTATVAIERGKNAGQTYHVVQVAADLWDTVMKAYAPEAKAPKAPTRARGGK